MNYFKDKAIRTLYTNIVTIRGDVAYDADEKEVKIDEKLVVAKAAELETKEETDQLAAKQAAEAKLAKLGLTTEDLKVLLG